MDICSCPFNGFVRQGFSAAGWHWVTRVSAHIGTSVDQLQSAFLELRDGGNGGGFMAVAQKLSYNDQVCMNDVDIERAIAACNAFIQGVPEYLPFTVLFLLFARKRTMIFFPVWTLIMIAFFAGSIAGQYLHSCCEQRVKKNNIQ